MQVSSIEKDSVRVEDRKSSNGRASISSIAAEEQQPSLVARMTEQIKAMAVRGSIYASFFLAKQPKRIRQVCCHSDNVTASVAQALAKALLVLSMEEKFFRTSAHHVGRQVR